MDRVFVETTEKAFAQAKRTGIACYRRRDYRSRAFRYFVIVEEE